jgi:predicted permease
MIPIAATIVLAGWAGLIAERRRPGRAGPASRSALTLVLYTVLPAVVFLNLVRADVSVDLGVGILLGWLVTAICALVAWAVGSRLLGLSRPELGALIVCVLVPNTAYLGYPLVGALFGFDRIGEAAAFDIGVGTIALLIGGFSVGAAFGDRAGSGARQRTSAFFTRNIPLYAAVAALVAPDSLAPDLLVDASRVAIALMLPLGFFAVGAALGEDERRGVRLPPRFTAAVGSVVAIKLVLMPLLLLALAAPLIDLPSTFLLLAAMPSGLNSMIVAHAYGLDLRITAGALTWTTAIVVPIALVASLL